VIDDYKNWNEHNRIATEGKFIPENPNYQQFGFDDNHCMYSNDESVVLTIVNTVKAATNESYFC